MFNRDNIGPAFFALKKRLWPDTHIGRSFKTLRKTGATHLARVSSRDSILAETMYLQHRFQSEALESYINVDQGILDDALKLLEQLFGLDVYLPKANGNTPQPPVNFYGDSDYAIE
jgi:hypothetical protein